MTPRTKYPRPGENVAHGGTSASPLAAPFGLEAASSRMIRWRGADVIGPAWERANSTLIIERPMANANRCRAACPWIGVAGRQVWNCGGFMASQAAAGCAKTGDGRKGAPCPCD